MITLKLKYEKFLTLWDIDGNLVDISKYQALADQKAIEKIFGVKPTFIEIEKNFGKPTKEVLAIPLRKYGISEKDIQENMNKMLELQANQLIEEIKNIDKNSGILLPGVIGILEKLKELQIPMNIVTGNIKLVGEGIIDEINLSKYFDSRINSYGDNINQRSEIISNAIKKAIKSKIIDKKSKVYVFGDTPEDVIAAKKNNCISIAVIKNSNSPESSPGGESYKKRKKALKKSRPDFLLDDYSDYKKIIAILNTN